MTYLIYNPLANNRRGELLKNEALEYLKDKFKKMKVINGYDLNVEKFITSIKKNDEIILVGGDGTLNHFVNYVYGKGFTNKFYIFKAGTGNDFINDVCTSKDEKLVLLNEYLQNLPKIIFNGQERYFLNCAGLGVDGLICKNINDIKMKGTKKASYTLVTVKALLFQYKKNISKIIVDGVEKKLKNVWLVTSMYGKYFGGGMPIAPYQDRRSHELSFCYFHCKSKLKTIFMFTSIFKAKHLKYKKYFSIVKCKVIEVFFEKPSVLQVDGETYDNVSSYKVIINEK